MTAPGHDGVVVIEAALNGATMPASNPTVPRTADEIADQAVACLDAGATVVHSHPPHGLGPDAELAEYRAAWRSVLARRPGALLYPTAGGGPAEQAWAHHEPLARDGLAALSLVDPGSVNVGMGPDGVVDPDLAGRAYVNTHADTEERLRRSAELGLVPSIAIFDPTFLRAVIGFARRGLVPPGAMLKLYFGDRKSLGLRPTPAALEAYLELVAESGLPWGAAVLGGDVLADGFAARVLDRGGHLRVGLEDHTQPATVTNVELVERAAALVRARGRVVADAAQARAVLGLPVVLGGSTPAGPPTPR